MPTNPTHPPRPSAMAVVVGSHHQSPTTFKLWKRRYRLLSIPHLNPNYLLDFSEDGSSEAAMNLPSPSRLNRRCFHRSRSTPCFSSLPVINNHESPQPQQQQQDDTNIAQIEVISSLRAKGTQVLVVETAVALASGVPLVPATSGLGGAYFLGNRSGECFAVIKPIGNVVLGSPAAGRPRLVSVHASETGLREVAAYLLDHSGFSGVPPTALIKISHPALHPAAAPAGSPSTKKIASIQRFVPHFCDAGDLGPSKFSVGSVHRIGILDIRLLNIDRHAGNILVVRNESGNRSIADELVPIDHGLCLPELLDDPYFEWLHWPQAAVPFSETELDYISGLDPYKDAALLRSELPSLPEPAIRIMILCSFFLKRAAAHGLCLADIGGMMTREYFCGLEEGPSTLEALCKRAEDSISTRSSFFLEESSGTNDQDYNEDHGHEQTVQFEMDCNDAAGFKQSFMEEMLDVPLFMRSTKQHKVSGEEEEENRDEPKLASISKSISLSAAELNYESVSVSSGKCISFHRMSEEEWGLFLEKFEQLLTEEFEEKKSMGMKQRLGS